MDVEEKRRGPVLVLYLSGRFDNAAAHEFVRFITSCIELGEQQILINFKQLSYLSSSGLRVLLGAAKRMQKKQGNLVLCSLTGIVWRVVEITKFDQILTIYNSEEEALRHFL